MLAPEHEVVALVGDGKAAVEAAAQLEPDLALLDISMPVMSGIVAARRLKKLSPSAKIVFVTGHVEPAYVDAAFRLGADGYVLKQNLAAELVDAVHVVLAGGKYRSPLLGGPAPTAPSSGPSLTEPCSPTAAPRADQAGRAAPQSTSRRRYASLWPSFVRTRPRTRSLPHTVPENY